MRNRLEEGHKRLSMRVLTDEEDGIAISSSLLPAQ
jgi:hypothetical protein